MNTSQDSYQYLEVQGERSDSHRSTECLLLEGPVPSLDGSNPDQVLVQIQYSSINYKDALAVDGHPGVARNLPLVPGIDAVGRIIASQHPHWCEGDRVIINTDQFGTATDGGWRQIALVPVDWLVRCPDDMSNYEVACLGTAGITAAWCVKALADHGTLESDRPLIVTGATGGVGSIAIEILGSHLKRNVVAVTGKTEATTWLSERGASEVISREEFVDRSSRPLLSVRWGGGIDTVGSSTLSTVLRSVTEGGCIAACGLAGGPELDITVYPFILRGVILYGIDCTRYSQQEKAAMWSKLGRDWLPTRSIQDTRTVTLTEAPAIARSLLAGTNTGRIVVDLQNKAKPIQ